MYKQIMCLLWLFVSFQVYDFTADDMQDLGEIGRGNYGTVNKMKHKKTNTVMAVKVKCGKISVFMAVSHPNIVQTVWHVSKGIC